MRLCVLCHNHHIDNTAISLLLLSPPQQHHHYYHYHHQQRLSDPAAQFDPEHPTTDDNDDTHTTPTSTSSTDIAPEEWADLTFTVNLPDGTQAPLISGGETVQVRGLLSIPSSLTHIVTHFLIHLPSRPLSSPLSSSLSPCHPLVTHLLIHLPSLTLLLPLSQVTPPLSLTHLLIYLPSSHPSSIPTSIPQVTWDNWREYVELFERVRLKESVVMYKALRDGLAQVLPIELLPLFNPEEIEQVVSGTSDVDVALLRQCTEYEDLTPDCALVQNFWSVLEDMTVEQRTLFLR